MKSKTARPSPVQAGAAPKGARRSWLEERRDHACGNPARAADTISAADVAESTKRRNAVKAADMSFGARRNNECRLLLMGLQRRFTSGDTIREIARDTYANAADVEALIRAHVRQHEDYEERTEETEWLERD